MPPSIVAIAVPTALSHNEPKASPCAFGKTLAAVFQCTPSAASCAGKSAIGGIVCSVAIVARSTRVRPAFVGLSHALPLQMGSSEGAYRRVRSHLTALRSLGFEDGDSPCRAKA